MNMSRTPLIRNQGIINPDHLDATSLPRVHCSQMDATNWSVLPSLVKQFETQVLRSLQHEREIDIWRVAVLMVNQHAQEA